MLETFIMNLISRLERAETVRIAEYSIRGQEAFEELAEEMEKLRRRALLKEVQDE